MVNGLSRHGYLSSYSFQITNILLIPTNTPLRCVSLSADKMSNDSAAVVRFNIPVTIISNYGASSSRDRDRTKAQEIAECSPPQCSSSPTTSEESTTATSTSSIYSDHDEPSTCQLLAPGATNSLADRTRSMSASHPTPAPHSPQRRGSKPCAREESLEQTSQPRLKSSLRLSLASLLSRLFTRRKKGKHGRAFHKACQDDQKESERLNRLSARQAFLPLR